MPKLLPRLELRSRRNANGLAQVPWGGGGGGGGVTFGMQEVNRVGEASSNVRTLNESEHDKLLIRCPGGDPRFSARLLERPQRRVFAIALGLVRDEQMRCVPRAFFRGHRASRSFQGGRALTWLYRIGRTITTSCYLRAASGAHFALEVEDGDSPPLPQSNDADPYDVVHRGELARGFSCARSLPPYHRGHSNGEVEDDYGKCRKPCASQGPSGPALSCANSSSRVSTPRESARGRERVSSDRSRCFAT